MNNLEKAKELKAFIETLKSIDREDWTLEMQQSIEETKKAERERIFNIISKICFDSQQYADMDEDLFWNTSTISPQDAQKRANYQYELLEELKKELEEKEC